jgi:hypothetical protein
VEAMENLDLDYPVLDAERKKELRSIRAALGREK